MAERGGRRQQTWGAPVSWREAMVLEAARAVVAARTGALSRADWLIGMAETLLRNAAGDTALPTHVAQRVAAALEALDAERAHLAAHPPQVGRRPSVG